jgi:hypothetical protein
VIRKIRRLALPLGISLVLAGAPLGREEYSRTVDRTVQLKGGQRVFIEHKFGQINVHTNSGPNVVVHAEVKVSAGSQMEAKDLADRIEIEIDPSSSDLFIRTHYPERMHTRNTSFSVQYDITMPESAPLEIRNSFGPVHVSGLKAAATINDSYGEVTFNDGKGVQHITNAFGRVEAKNNHGDVFVESSYGAVNAGDIDGALEVRNRFAAVTVANASKGVDVVNSNGSVEVTDCGGPGSVKNTFGSVVVRNQKGRLSVSNGNGKVEVSDIGGDLNVVNTFGSVSAQDVRGPAKIQSSNSSVTARNIKGDTSIKTSFGSVQASEIAGVLTVDNQNGAVRVSDARGAQVNTSFGSVVLDEINGAIHVENQNGAVEATSTATGACQPIQIRTSFSSIRVRVGQENYRVTARTSFGRIKSDLPITVSGITSNDELNGVIGGGSCELRLTNSNGTIEIQKR